MYHVAIVEDELEFSNQLKKYLKQYQEENDVEFQISVFRDGAEILAGYRPKDDAIFMDIEMPGVNGMDAAEKMLELDTFVKCNHWYLVNLRHVKEVKKNIAVVGKYELEISRRNKTAFMKALTEYLGENI